MAEALALSACALLKRALSDLLHALREDLDRVPSAAEIEGLDFERARVGEPDRLIEPRGHGSVSEDQARLNGGVHELHIEILIVELDRKAARALSPELVNLHVSALARAARRGEGVVR